MIMPEIMLSVIYTWLKEQYEKGSEKLLSLALLLWETPKSFNQRMLSLEGLKSPSLWLFFQQPVLPLHNE